MDKINVIFLVVMAFVALTSAGTVSRPRHARVNAPIVSDLLAPAKGPEQVPVQPVQESDEQEAVVEEQEAVVVDAGSGDEDVATEESAAPIAAGPPGPCDDVSGVWQTRTVGSEARIALVQDADDREIHGLFRIDSESGWYELQGRRARHQGAAFAFNIIADEGNAAGGVTGHCHSCEGTGAFLELHGVHSVLTPSCGQSHAITYVARSFDRVGDAAEARTLVKAVFGEEDSEGEEAQADVEEEAAAVPVVEKEIPAEGSGDE